MSTRHGQSSARFRLRPARRPDFRSASRPPHRPRPACRSLRLRAPPAVRWRVVLVGGKCG
eukprot:8177642-Alexandrium_andersonii.AAC.1